MKRIDFEDVHSCLGMKHIDFHVMPSLSDGARRLQRCVPFLEERSTPS